MTGRDSRPPAASIEQWKIDLLQRVHDLASEFRRINAAGAEGYDGTDGDGTNDWLDHLDALSAAREATERIALSVGIPQPLIERARTVGAEYAPTPPPELSPEPASEATQFYLDMLSVDVWNLQRMAYVAAARELRETDGTYEFSKDPFAGAEYHHNMHLLHRRARALAAAADISHDDAEKLWGTTASADLRQVTAVAINSWDNLTLEFVWRQYARPHPASAVPPYLDAHDHPEQSPSAISPPTPEQLITQAAHDLREHRFTPPTPHWDIEIAVDMALPATTEWQWGPEPSTPDTTAAPRPPTPGLEP